MHARSGFGRRVHSGALGLTRVALVIAFAVLVALTEPVSADARPVPFRVPENGSYIGAFAGSSSPLSQFNADSGRQHAFFMKFVEVGGAGFDEGPGSCAQFAEECTAQGAIPYFTLEPFSATSGALLTPSDAEWLREFARDLGVLRKPAFIRFAHEMNGKWYPWGWTKVPPATYISGFRQASDIFRQEAPEAAMVWAPSQNWGDTTDALYSTWYPGDEWVDWVGLTTYQWEYSGLSSTQFNDSIKYGKAPEGNFYRTFAVGHDKPMIIAETACGDDHPGYYDNVGYGDSTDEVGTYGTEPGLGAQQWWIRQVYSAGDSWNTVSSQFPRIKAVAWFAVEDVGKSGADFQLGGSDPTSHSAGFDAYSAAVANPYWFSAVPDPEVGTVLTTDAELTGWNTRDVTLTLSAQSTNAVEPLRTWYALEGGRQVIYDGALSLGVEGTTAFSFHTEDQAGVRDETQTVSVRIDKTAPRTSSDAGATYEGPASIRLVADDGTGSGVALTEWNLDDGGWVSGPVVSTRVPGVHTLQFRSADVAGNTEDTRFVSFEVRVPSTSALSSTSKPALGYGSTFSVGGNLSAVGVPLAGHHIVLQSRVPGAEFKDTSRETTTAEDGAFMFCLKPTTKTYYRVRYAGATGYLPSASPSAYATPKVYVRTPIARSIMSRFRYYTVYGWLRPRHASGTYPVRIYKWKRTSGGGWRSYGYEKAKVSNPSHYSSVTSKYARSIRLPYRGKWRLRASAPADSGHAATWSSGYDYVTVR